MDFTELEVRLADIEESRSFDSCRKLVLSIIKLLDRSIDSDELGSFKLFTDGDGKLTSNGSWFLNDNINKDRKATYKVDDRNEIHLDFKCYGVNKLDKRTIAWVQALTPNFEDEDFNSKFDVGIDFFIPSSCDRVLVVLSSHYVVRTLELRGSLTATYKEILFKWSTIDRFDNKRVLHTQLWDSFDLNPINQKFYQGIFERFIGLRQHLLQNQILPEREASYFANRLLGRLVFCWFLRKKNYIDESFQYFDSSAYEDDTDYYREKLEILFFGTLNSPMEERRHADLRSPYLNGGLFEEKADDLLGKNLSFPKKYFDDLFAFLHSYNFTTDESTSQFQQVAIDPEMLGRIFENLLAEIVEETGEQARKANGTFYTPREIVDYMCREALKSYLKNRIVPDQHLDARLFQLIDATDREFQDQDHNWRRDWKPYRERFLEALDELKVLDPACGSGAFPMGMLQLLVKVYERLEPRFDHYKAKLQILERNIFGVDIEPMAIEISRLRAWLSIVVDSDLSSSLLSPLPNLDFKFVCANSLIPLSAEGNVAFGEDPDFAVKLQSIRARYFATETASKKLKLKSEYESMIFTEVSLFGESRRTSQLKTYHPFDSTSPANFFDSLQMFGVTDFDLVIANPPYISSMSMAIGNQAETREYISNNYQFAKGNWDIYIAFFEKGIDLLSKEGVLIFITPDKWVSKPFGDALRTGQIGALQTILLAGRKVFTSAKVDSIITTFNACKVDSLTILEYVKGSISRKRVVDKGILKSPFVLDFLFSDHTDFLLRVENASKKLSDFAECENSCATNDAYKLKPFVKELKGEFDPESHFKIINTGTISKFVDRWGISKMTYLGNKYLAPVVNRKTFLKNFPNSYSKKAVKPKIIIKGLNLLDCSLDLEGVVIPGVTTLVVTADSRDDLLFVLGILNSNFAFFYIRERYPASSYNQGTTFTKEMLSNLPMPKEISSQEKLDFIELIRGVVGAQSARSNLDSERDILKVNSAVNHLFGFSEEEVELFKPKKKVQN